MPPTVLNYSTPAINLSIIIKNRQRFFYKFIFYIVDKKHLKMYNILWSLTGKCRFSRINVNNYF